MKAQKTADSPSNPDRNQNNAGDVTLTDFKTYWRAPVPEDSHISDTGIGGIKLELTCNPSPWRPTGSYSIGRCMQAAKREQKKKATNSSN